MSNVLTVILLALLWSFLAGAVNPLNLLTGMFLGFLTLSLVRAPNVTLLSFLRRFFWTEKGALPRRSIAFMRFLLSFFWELVVANITIALLALKPKPVFHPHIIAVPLAVTSDGAIAFLCAVITLLPGTVAMGVSEDKGLLYAHAIGTADIEAARESVKRMERLILGFME